MRGVAVLQTWLYPREADSKGIWQSLVLLGAVEAVGDTGGMQDAPKTVAGVGVMVPATSRRERGVVAAKHEPQAGFEEILGHGGLRRR